MTNGYVGCGCDVAAYKQACRLAIFTLIKLEKYIPTDSFTKKVII